MEISFFKFVCLDIDEKQFSPVERGIPFFQSDWKERVEPYVVQSQPIQDYPRFGFGNVNGLVATMRTSFCACAEHIVGLLQSQNTVYGIIGEL
nr:hypothetical protein [Collibacillus ludicampi]